MENKQQIFRLIISSIIFLICVSCSQVIDEPVTDIEVPYIHTYTKPNNYDVKCVISDSIRIYLKLTGSEYISGSREYENLCAVYRDFPQKRCISCGMQGSVIADTCFQLNINCEKEYNINYKAEALLNDLCTIYYISAKKPFYANFNNSEESFWNIWKKENLLNFNQQPEFLLGTEMQINIPLPNEMGEYDIKLKYESTQFKFEKTIHFVY